MLWNKCKRACDVMGDVSALNVLYCESGEPALPCQVQYGRTNADFFHSVKSKKRNHLHHPNFGEFPQIRSSILLTEVLTENSS